MQNDSNPLQRVPPPPHIVSRPLSRTKSQHDLTREVCHFLWKKMDYLAKRLLKGQQELEESAWERSLRVLEWVGRL